MSGAEVTEVEGGFLVTCDAHSLIRGVETGQHAANLQALHNRMDHADDTDSIEVDLTAAASMVRLAAAAGGELEAESALTVWAALTGMPRTEALAYAQQLADVDPPLTAAVPPF